MSTNTPSTPKTWGTTAAEFYAGLRDKPAQIVTMDGKVYKGQLVGVDQYDLLLKQSGGVTILIAKHAVKLVRVDAPGLNGQAGK